MEDHESEESKPSLEHRLDDDDRFLDIIARSDDLKAHLSDAPTAAHRAAIVDIHSYLQLLEGLSDLSPAELKLELGCKRGVEQLPECSIDELERSRGFLSLAAEVTLAVEAPSEAVRESIKVAVETFRRAKGDRIVAHQCIDSDLLAAIAVGDMKRVHARIEEFFARQRIKLLTASGKTVVIDAELAAGLAQAALKPAHWIEPSGE